MFPRLTLGYCSPGRSSTYIKERYGPYVAGAYFILKQGGAVKYDGKGVTMGLGEAGERLSPGLFSQSDSLPCVPWSLPPPGCVARDLFLTSVKWDGSCV